MSGMLRSLEIPEGDHPTNICNVYLIVLQCLPVLSISFIYGMTALYYYVQYIDPIAMRIFLTETKQMAVTYNGNGSVTHGSI